MRHRGRTGEKRSRRTHDMTCTADAQDAHARQNSLGGALRLSPLQGRLASAARPPRASGASLGARRRRRLLRRRCLGRRRFGRRLSLKRVDRSLLRGAAGQVLLEPSILRARRRRVASALRPGCARWRGTGAPSASRPPPLPPPTTSPCPMGETPALGVAVGLVSTLRPVHLRSFRFMWLSWLHHRASWLSPR